jgi:hypothetical protein
MDCVFLFGGRIHKPVGGRVALCDIKDFCEYVKRKLEEVDAQSPDHLLTCDLSFDDVCLTLIGISLEKNWGIPVMHQEGRENMFRHFLGTSFGTSLQSIYKMPYAVVRRLGDTDIQIAELHIVDDCLVMVY